MTTEMNYDFIKDIVSDQEKASEVEKPSGGFKLGFALGMLGASMVFVSLEVGALVLALLLFGVQLTFWQGLAIVLIYKYILLQINSKVDS